MIPDYDIAAVDIRRHLSPSCPVRTTSLLVSCGPSQARVWRYDREPALYDTKDLYGHNMHSCTRLYNVVQGYIVNAVYIVYNIVQLAAL